MPSPVPASPTPEKLNDLGVLLARGERCEQAIACYRAALALRPGFPLALANLGRALQRLGRGAAALAAFRAAVAADPGDADSHEALATALAQLGHPAEAAAEYRQALAIEPGHLAALTNFGKLRRREGAHEEALALHRQAAALASGNVEILNHLGLTQHERGALHEAIAVFRQALAGAREFAPAHLNLAMSLLASGALREGAAEYEWRWRGEHRLPNIDAPLWDGRPLDDGTLLLWAEQGLGDAIQFVRYAPTLRPLARRIVLACPPALARLMETAPGVDRVVPFGQVLPPVSAYLPLMSTMRLLATTLETIPAEIPYVAPPREQRKKVAAAFRGMTRPKVGIVWAGHPRHADDQRRSLAIASFAPLLEAFPRVYWCSLQVGPRAVELRSAPLPCVVHDFAPLLRDFADTAAIVSELDLVIAVDTAVAHLAGALGRPAWVLLPFTADWRWLRHRSDSPWYPSLRLFRQVTPGDWPGVIDQVREALGTWLRSPRAPIALAQAADG